MAGIPAMVEGGGLVLRGAPFLKRMDDHEFFDFCQQNRELRIERTSTGDLVIMPPTGSETGRIESNINAELNLWAREDGSGVAFGSSAGFTLPSGAVRSPDAAWIERARWLALSEDSRRRFAPVCPDFVVEIRSASDALAELQSKMEEYLANGTRLAWLIDPVERRVHVYAPGAAVRVLDDPTDVSGGPVLRGFRVAMHAVWG